jgi:hypothetical protein
MRAASHALHYLSLSNEYAEILGKGILRVVEVEGQIYERKKCVIEDVVTT